MALLGAESQLLTVLGPLRGNQSRAFVGQILPDFLGDEGHKRMQQPQQLIQNIDKHLQGGLLTVGILGIQPCLGQLDIPVAVGVPDKVVHLLDSHAQLILFQILGNFSNQGIQLG